MPDPCKDEETQTRTHSLCLFGTVGITVLNRCANCPGAARTPLGHKRCPLEALQPNIFLQEGPDSKISAAPKTSASSSKQHDSWHHEAETVLTDRFDRLSLEDSDRTAGTFGRSESDPDIPSGSAELSGTPPISHGVKRKAEQEDGEHKYQKNQIDQLSVQDYWKSKPLKPFSDLEAGNQFVRGCRRVRSDERTALLMNRSEASPMDTQEGRPSGEASSSPRLFVPGYSINTELHGRGVLPCNDGIEADRYFEEMEIEEP